MNKILIFITTITALLTTSIGVSACLCAQWKTLKENIVHSDRIVVGEVLNEEIITSVDSTNIRKYPTDTTMWYWPQRKIHSVRYDFLVSVIYKGKVTSQKISIYTGIGGGDCGFPFQVGQKYIVFGKRDNYYGGSKLAKRFKFPKGTNIIWTNICMRTTSYLGSMEKEIGELCKPKVPINK